MTNVKSTVIRYQNSLVAKLSFSFGSLNSKAVSLEFWSKDEILDIVGTRSGYILKRKIHLTKPLKFLDVYVEYKQNIECRIGYFDSDDNLESSETIQIELEYVQSVEDKKTINSVNLDSKKVNFQDKLADFQESIKSIRSPWHLKLVFDENIIVTALRHGPDPITVSFGRQGHEIDCSDFICTVYPEIKTFVIPIELVLRNYGKYGNEAKLAIFELVKADFHSIPNLLYKHQISNSVNLRSIKSSKEYSIENFLDPLGKPLGANWVVKNNLPVLI